eukprot:gnl/TRDRNA2_/TRDRNA2_167333_c4_seq1.p1 gnl/TRDRNA2_/TRDRNA2_167333_c4~~gnl/TRDRNA2_/TRDRNA2_167333_c4_seq1.p1  ORF type:complete len:822 (-),score=197.86 gnl/TRDRNA2_/TRDRNA2_167333_c4_seq1:111-2576(-)
MDTLEALLIRLGGGSSDKLRLLVHVLRDNELVTCSQLLARTQGAASRDELQSTLSQAALKSKESSSAKCELLLSFVSSLRQAVEDGRLSRSFGGFPRPPHGTGCRILFTAPHCLHLQREGHKPHKPEAYTRELAMDFAGTVHGAFLTWTSQEIARVKDEREVTGEPDQTNQDPNFTPQATLGESPWTRNVGRVRERFGMSSHCLHVDLHGCKDPGPSGGSHLVVGIGAMECAGRDEAAQELREKLRLAFAVALRNRFSVQVKPLKQLTGVCLDPKYLTLTQQSMRSEGGGWTHCVQIEMCRSLRDELKESKELRTCLAKAIMFSWILISQEDILEPARIEYMMKNWERACEASFRERGGVHPDSGPQRPSGAVQDSEEANAEENDNRGELTANSEPAPPCFAYDKEAPFLKLMADAKQLKAGRPAPAGEKKETMVDDLRFWLSRPDSEDRSFPAPARPASEMRNKEKQGSDAGAVSRNMLLEAAEEAKRRKAESQQEAKKRSIEAEKRLKAEQDAMKKRRAQEEAEAERIRAAQAQEEVKRRTPTLFLEEMVRQNLCWRIVGGEDKGGVLVREGILLSSDKLEKRISFGSLVQELALVDDRLRFKLIQGQGPAEGWISREIDQVDPAGHRWRKVMAELYAPPPPHPSPDSKEVAEVRRRFKEQAAEWRRQANEDATELRREKEELTEQRVQAEEDEANRRAREDEAMRQRIQRAQEEIEAEKLREAEKKALREAESEDMEVIVHTNHSLGFFTPIQLKRGATIWRLKEALAGTDPTAKMEPSHFGLRLCGPQDLGLPLDDGMVITESMRELDVFLLGEIEC